jgi:hypothetical protein
VAPIVMLFDVTPGDEPAALALLASNPVLSPASDNAKALMSVNGRRNCVIISPPM